MKYSSHSTYYNKDGIEVVSATSVLKILNKPFLSKWANAMGFKRRSVDKLLKESSEKGELIHELLNSYLFNNLFVYIRTIDDDKKDILAYSLDNFIKWKKENTIEIEPIFGEKKFSCDTFGGTVDLYCNLNGKKTILDFKTSKSFYSSMFLQLAGYTHMLEDNGYEVEQVCILLINENICEIKYMSRDEIGKYINIFLSLVELFYKIYDINLEWKDLL